MAQHAASVSVIRRACGVSSLSGNVPAAPPTSPGQDAAIWGAVFTRFKDVDGNSFALVGFDEVSREIGSAAPRARARSWKPNGAPRRKSKSPSRCRPGSFRKSCRPLETLEYAGDLHPGPPGGRRLLRFPRVWAATASGLVIGDIAGKGIAGALLMANLQANLRSQCAMASDQPQRFLRSVNQLFYENTADSAYATLFFAEYDDRARRLRYANCGHLCAPCCCGATALWSGCDSTCSVLGLFKDVGLRDRRTPASVREIRWPLYTDGVTEAFNDAEEEFGDQRLIAALRRHRKQESQAMVAAIVDEVRGFGPHEQYDDITLIVAKCR